MTATPSDRRRIYQTTAALPMLDSADALKEAERFARAARPQPADPSIPKQARYDVFTHAVLAWGSIAEARKFKILRWVWMLLRVCSPSYGYAATDLFSWPSVMQFIHTTDFESDAQGYAAFKVCRRIGRNLSPQTWRCPVAQRNGDPVDLTPYSTRELDYFGGLSKSLDWHQYGQRFLMVFLLAISFGLSARDIAVAHGADCRISGGPVRIYATYGRPRIIPADDYFAKRLRSHIKKRKDSYLVDTATSMPTEAIVRAALQPAPLIEAGAKVPTIPRLASTWRYRRLAAGLPVPAITYLSGRSSHQWLDHFGTLGIGLTGDDFANATKAPEGKRLEPTTTLRLFDYLAESDPATDFDLFPERDDLEPFYIEDHIDDDDDDDDAWVDGDPALSDDDGLGDDQ